MQGVDPLAPYGEHAARVLRRAVLLAEAPDLYMNSTVDPDTLDIAAFEPLVGAHGGLGGWQDRAVLLVPTELAGALPEGRIEGADHLHRVLVEMLESLGQRRDLPCLRRPESTARAVGFASAGLDVPGASRVLAAGASASGRRDAAAHPPGRRVGVHQHGPHEQASSAARAGPPAARARTSRRPATGRSG